MRFLPFAIAIVIFIIVSFVFRTGARTLAMPVLVGYGAVLVIIVAAVCRKWTAAHGPRLAAYASAAGHVASISAYFVGELLRPEGISRVGNAFRGLGVEYILISIAYPLRLGGVLVGLGTALVLILLAHFSRVRAERFTEQS
ncbi:MAG TPA: hypothetical protein VF618_15760 [Thermoanaerobaculia bacterium]